MLYKKMTIYRQYFSTLVPCTETLPGGLKAVSEVCIWFAVEIVLEINGSSVAHTSGLWATEEPLISNTISFMITIV